MNEKQKADVVAEIRRGFFNRNAQDKVISAFAHKVGYRTATQEDAAAYAERLGENLSKTLREIYGRRFSFDGWKAISDEEQVYALAKDLIDPLMRLTHTMVNDAGAQAQKIADEAIGLGIRSVVGEYPGERLNGLYRKIAEAAVKDREVQRAVSGEQVSRDSKREWRGGKPIGTSEQKQDAGSVESWLGEPVVNNVQAFYDEHVRANAEARFNMGLGPVIVRVAAPGCCNWCATRAGVYVYEEVLQTGSEVFRRHKFCRCTVTYRDGGFRQYVWGREQWEADRKTLEKRKIYGLDDNKPTPPPPEEFIRQEEEKALATAENRGIIERRGMANGLRKSYLIPMSKEEIAFIKSEIISIKADINVFRFVDGIPTGYSDSRDLVYISSSVFPSNDGSGNPTDLLSPRAVIAHEYYGHRMYRNSKLSVGSWNDEFRASYMAAKNCPNLPDEDRAGLIRDALYRANQAGISIKYNGFIRSVLYGVE